MVSVENHTQQLPDHLLYFGWPLTFACIGFHLSLNWPSTASLESFQFIPIELAFHNPGKTGTIWETLPIIPFWIFHEKYNVYTFLLSRFFVCDLYVWLSIFK